MTIQVVVRFKEKVMRTLSLIAMILVFTSCSMYTIDTKDDFSLSLTKQGPAEKIYIDLKMNVNDWDNYIVDEYRYDLMRAIADEFNKIGIKVDFASTLQSGRKIVVSVSYLHDNTFSSYKTYVSALSFGIVPVRYSGTLGVKLINDLHVAEKQYDFHFWNHLVFLPALPFLDSRHDVLNHIYRSIARDIAKFSGAAR